MPAEALQPYSDVFPAFLSVTPADVEIELTDLRSSPPSKGSFQVSITRVVVTGGRIIVAQDGPTGPTVVFSEPIDPTTFFKSQDRAVDSFVQTISGKKLAWRKDSACGCGSRLKSWSPGKFLTSFKDPTS